MSFIYLHKKATPPADPSSSATFPVFHHRRPQTEELLNEQQQFHEHLSASMEQLQHSFSLQQQQHEHLYAQWQEMNENDQTVKKAILDSLSVQENTMKRLAQQIAFQDELYQGLSARLEGQEKLYQKLAEKLELQGVFHDTVIKRLEAQEASQYKIMRQLDTIKEIIFERCTHIVETIKQTISSIFTRNSQQPSQTETSEKELMHM
ncbi:hypothetical protein B6A27_07805 [Anoxybacillus sp. UARK-01]|uniref:hypothetical protein n=1 Tax=Anoxybacillus sp. UARK-01 TaxID=1895648 RepID=UPI0009BC02B2|nr:hypothetical protein [Anoxybacillus sp. UARK-01]OQM46095.1 hypothetical protein B6A27_07805 [Anoxybacillus sp. UARK-01]